MTEKDSASERSQARAAACAACPERAPIGRTNLFRCAAANCNCIWNVKLKFRGTTCPRGKW